MQAKQRKRQTSHKSRLAEVERQATAIMADAEARIKVVRKKAGKMSSLARVLQPFARPQLPGSPCT
jgi:hypothetical protein